MKNKNKKITRNILTETEYKTMALKDRYLWEEYLVRYVTKGPDGYWKKEEAAVYAHGKAAHEAILHALPELGFVGKDFQILYC